MTFMKQVVLFWYFASLWQAKYRNYTRSFINFILNDHECKILFITWPLQWSKIVKITQVQLSEQHTVSASVVWQILGVHIDNNLTWSIHIQFIVKKISSNLWLLSKLKKYLSLEHRVQFYKTYIQPHIDYCSTVWGGTSHSNLDRIYRLQKWAVKIIVDYEYNNDIACSIWMNLKFWIFLKENFLEKQSLC